VAGTFAAISGLGFAVQFLLYARVSQSPMTYAYTGVPDFEEAFFSPLIVFNGMLIMFIGPLITMRLLAGERSRGTMELLLTQPLRDRDIIFGKYLAALLMLLPMMGVIVVHLLVVNLYAEVEPAVLAFGLLTVFLMGAAFMSLGLFVSALANNPITAGVMTFGLWFVSYILGVLAKDLPETLASTSRWAAGPGSALGFVYHIFRALAHELPLDAHAEYMAQGVVQPSDIVYYLLFCALFLFLTFRAFESRKWRA